MSDSLTLLLAAAAGAGLGTVFFGGLWWTVQRGLSSRVPAAWLLGSLLVRMAMALVGFYLVAGGHWQRLVAALIGFVLARAITLRFAPPHAREPRHAP